MPSPELVGRVAAYVGTALLAVALAGCQASPQTQRNTAGAALVGAVAGAAIAHGTGGKAATGAVAGAAVAGVGTYVWSQHMERQRHALAQAMQGTPVQVTRTPHNQIKLYIPADVSFNSGSATLKPAMQRTLNQVATSLQRNPHTHVLIVGHADSSGNARTNESLSLARANAARRYLFARKVSGVRIQTSGRGAREPVASNATSTGRAKNRRVEILVMQQP